MLVRWDSHHRAYCGTLSPCSQSRRSSPSWLSHVLWQCSSRESCYQTSFEPIEPDSKRVSKRQVRDVSLMTSTELAHIHLGPIADLKGLPSCREALCSGHSGHSLIR